MPHLLMIVNEDRFFLSHRKEIALHAQKNGYDVTIVTKNTGRCSEVEALGLKMLELPINPTGENLLEEVRTFFFLYKLYRIQKPDIVHHVGLKNILWGSLAAKLAKVHGVVNAVSGLGVLFSQEKESFMATIILNVLRFSHHRKNIIVIFQNKEDRQLFLDKKVIKEEQIQFIKGSGIDLNDFPYTSLPQEEPVRVLFAARMVEEKGTLVLAKAAELLRDEYEGKVLFLLCGGLSTNPKAIKESELKEHCDGEYIQWLGHRTDIPDLLKKSHIVAFPSYYREGVPKSLIEATAIGRPIVTTNSIGCKDTVEDGYNGFLIPIKDSQSLADKLKLLIDDFTLRKQMGLHSRRIAERDFSITDVVTKHLCIYNNLLKYK